MGERLLDPRNQEQEKEEIRVKQSTAPMFTKILREYDKLTNLIHENSS